MGKAVKAVLAVSGAMIFFFGVYILPFGTDFWVYFWVEKIEHGDWIRGDILANGSAILLIIIGAILLYKAGKSPIPKDRKKKRSNKHKKKSEEVMYL